MTERVFRLLVDDLDGSIIPPDTGEQLTFALRGREYQIDLSDHNVAKLDAALQPFIDAATQIGGPRRRRRRQEMHDQDALVRSPAIREWARDNGYRCSARGRLRSDIVQAYAKAHGENISALRGPSRRLEAARVQDAEEAYLQENTG